MIEKINTQALLDGILRHVLCQVMLQIFGRHGLKDAAHHAQQYIKRWCRILGILR